MKLWKGQEDQIRERVERGGQSHCRIEGGGRPIRHELLDKDLARWVADMRQDKKRVSRRRLQAKAKEMHAGMKKDDSEPVSESFSASNGWLQRFMSRHNLRMRRVTTACQKTPTEYLSRLVRFVL